ncbi:MAG: hypothetical protein JXB85_16185 [Anaerolineales bacterium]|nr:hypothetical protein [Anaerolineales bacterium]
MGMLLIGLYLYGPSNVENAARHAARMGTVSRTCAPGEAVSAAESALSGQPVIRETSVSVLAPGGVVGTTVPIRVTAQIPMVIPGGEAFGLGALTKKRRKAPRFSGGDVRRFLVTVTGITVDPGN